jgi:hypothetical protein
MTPILADSDYPPEAPAKIGVTAKIGVSSFFRRAKIGVSSSFRRGE